MAQYAGVSSELLTELQSIIMYAAIAPYGPPSFSARLSYVHHNSANTWMYLGCVHVHQQQI